MFPEREIAFRPAQRLPSKTVLDYIPLPEGHSIVAGSDADIAAVVSSAQ